MKSKLTGPSELRGIANGLLTGLLIQKGNKNPSSYKVRDIIIKEAPPGTFFKASSRLKDVFSIPGIQPAFVFSKGSLLSCLASQHRLPSLAFYWSLLRDSEEWECYRCLCLVHTWGSSAHGLIGTL